MPNEEKCNEVGAKPNAKPSLSLQTDPATDEDPPTATANPASTETKKQSDNLKQIAVGERWLIGVGIAGVFVSVVLGYIYYGQLKEMRLATKASADAVELARDTLDYNASQFDRAQRETIEQTVASTISSNASIQALRDSEEFFKRDERAWIVPSTPQKRTKNDGRIYFDVIFSNTGKTPGFNVRGILTGTSSINLIPKVDIYPGNHSGAVVPQQAPYHLSQVNEAIPQSDLSQNIAGMPLYLYGTLWYDDVFSRHHWVQFCDSTSGDLASFSPCALHNNTDDQIKQKH